MTATAEQERMEGYPWWLVLIQGIAALIIGVLLLINPRMTTVILIQILGIYWLIDGIFSIVRIFLKNTNIHWGWLLFRGILGILAGLLVVQNPLWSAILVPVVMVIILAIYGLFAGAIGLVEGFRGSGVGAIILGLLSIVIGILMLVHRFAFAFVLPVVVGIFAIIGGIIAIVYAFKLR